MKWQFEHEEHNRREKSLKPDYRERFQIEGDWFDRGADSDQLIRFFGSSISVKVKPFLREAREKMLRQLENVRFTFRGFSGTIWQLKKNNAIRSAVEDRFEMTRVSVLRAPCVGVAFDSKRSKECPLLQFTLFLKPENDSFPVAFHGWFAFRAEISVKE